MSRTGVIATKIGMSRFYEETGEHVPVTLLKVESCQVVSVRTQEKDGYSALQVGAGAIKAKNVSKSLKGHFAKAKVEPKRDVVEFRVSEDALIAVGEELLPTHYVPGQIVDVAGTSIGKGFAGGMKRHNFGGLEATHGVSISHRSHGSTGQCQDPGRVFKGKKMAGHLGDERVTIQSLRIIETDVENGIIVVSGAVPGSNGGTVFITDSKKYALHPDAPYPAGTRSAANKNTAEATSAEEAPAEEVQEEVKEVAAEAPAEEVKTDAENTAAEETKE